MGFQGDFYVMSTFVASCRSEAAAMELARFLERKFPFNPRIRSDQLHQFIVVFDVDGAIQVHSAVAVNDLGREDFAKFVAEFKALKMGRPVQNMRPTGTLLRAA